MARNEWEVDDDESTEDGPKALREALKKANKQIAELTEKVSGYETKFRSQSVSDVLKTKDLSPKLAKHILRDIDGDPTPEAIDEWLTENADVFGFTVGSSDTTSVVSAEDQAALSRIAQVENSSARPIGEEAEMAKLMAATTPEQLRALLGQGV